MLLSLIKYSKDRTNSGKNKESLKLNKGMS